MLMYFTLCAYLPTFTKTISINKAQAIKGFLKFTISLYKEIVFSCKYKDTAFKFGLRIVVLCKLALIITGMCFKRHMDNRTLRSEFGWLVKLGEMQG